MSKKRVVGSWILRLAVAAVLGPAVYYKFTDADAAIQNFEALEMEPTGRYVVGMLELLTIILVLIPRSVAWGGILGWGLMTGALIAHATELGFTGAAMPSALMAIATWLLCAALCFLHRKRVVMLDTMFGGKAHR